MLRKVIPCLLAAAFLLSADTLVLRSGNRLDGSFVGGDARSVRFAVGSQVNTYSLNDVQSIEFNGGTSSSGSGFSSPAPQGNPAPQTSNSAANTSADAGPMGVEVPADTEIVVRLIDKVDSDTDHLGQTYRVSIDQPVIVNGQTVIQRGTDAVAELVDAEKSGHIQGKTIMTLDLRSININGRNYDVATGGVTQASSSRGARSAKVIGGTAALGAIIGGIAGGGKGAAIGTVAGAGAGTAAQVATSGQRVKIPSETRLTFRLKNPLNL